MLLFACPLWPTLIRSLEVPCASEKGAKRFHHDRRFSSCKHGELISTCLVLQKIRSCHRQPKGRSVIQSGRALRWVRRVLQCKHAQLDAGAPVSKDGAITRPPSVLSVVCAHGGTVTVASTARSGSPSPVRSRGDGSSGVWIDDRSARPRSNSDLACLGS